MKIIKGDKVLVISGKDRGKTGKVLTVMPKSEKIVVENVNVAKKHQRSKRQGQPGQMVSLPKPIWASNAKLICPKCGKATRVGYDAQRPGKIAIRLCKKCKAEI